MLPQRLPLRAALVLAVAAAGCTKRSPEPDPGPNTPFRITVQLDWVAEPEHGGLYQALAKGYFKQEGLDVVLLQGGPNTFVMQKLATHQVDIGEADSTNTLVAISQGLPVTHIAAVFQNDPSVLMLHADNPVRRFEDLDGKTIMARPEWVFLSYLRHKYHISFKLIPQNFQVANFVADPNFIQQGFYTAEPYYIVKGGAKYPKFLFEWDAGFDAYAALVANRPWALGHPQQLRAFLRAYIRGWKEYIGGDPAPANALLKRDNPNNTDEFLDFCRSIMVREKLVVGRGAPDDSLVGRISPERFRVQIGQLEELGIVPKGRLTPGIVMTDYLP